ncbi:hypothetical protein PYCCODRAFT_361459 [Trametes coccinea BRFM310]|uniref:Uncharacterized protein n=1 Tax=Trametes coccinea (strain BRFM310) TaxID=1353009 RepID=A0A1Y2J500_TRAC3|nr:hypothetical protein PYCCODRAFT_361459 [Trametes coccinea BRFM310]
MPVRRLLRSIARCLRHGTCLPSSRAARPSHLLTFLRFLGFPSSLSSPHPRTPQHTCSLALTAPCHNTTSSPRLPGHVGADSRADAQETPSCAIRRPSNASAAASSCCILGYLGAISKRLPLRHIHSIPRLP